MPLVNLSSVALVAIVALTSAVGFIWLAEVVRGSACTARLARGVVDAHRTADGRSLDLDPAELGAHHAALSAKSDLLAQQVRAMASYSTRAMVTVAVAAFGTTGAAAVLLLLVRRRIARPIELLLAATDRVAEGHFDHRVGYEAHDEMGILARAFDRMAARLESSLREVDHQKQALEHGIAKATAELRTLSRTDDVTGLPNLRHLADAFAGLAAHARAAGTPLALTVLGIDDFAEINARYGYEAGNLVLVALARSVQAAARHVDVAARGNGVQFLILMPGLVTLPPESLDHVTGSLRSVQRLIQRRTGHEICLSVRQGCAQLGDDGATLDSLVAAAVRRLSAPRRCEGSAAPPLDADPCESPARRPAQAAGRAQPQELLR